MMNTLIYLVEGETEKKLINTLKTELMCIKPGRVSVVNVVQQSVSSSLFVSLGGKITCVLVFDTDNNGEGTLIKNIINIRALPNVKEVICVPQVRNFEDELCQSCTIKDIRDLTGSKSKSDVKRDILKMSNFADKLLGVGFQISLLWNRTPMEGFSGIKNEAFKIKL